MLPFQAMPDPLACLFDPPATVIEFGKRRRRKGRRIEQRRHRHMHTSIRGRHPQQTNGGRRRRAVIILGIARIGSTQDDDLLTSSRQQEFAYRFASLRRIAPNTKMNAASRQRRNQSTTGKATIHHQQIIRAPQSNRLEEHRPLNGQRRMQAEVQKQRDPRQIEAQGDPLEYRTDVVLPHRQADRRAIGRDDTPASPARDWQMLFHPPHPVLIDRAEHPRDDPVTRWVESLCGDLANRIGTMAQIGEEGVQFRLDRLMQAGERNAQAGRQGEKAPTGEILGVEASLIERFFRKQIAREPANNDGTFKPS